MTTSLTIALAQLNPIMGDVAGNCAKLFKVWQEVQAEGEPVDLLIASELFLTGYMPEDFVLKSGHLKIIRKRIENLSRQTASGPAILMGAPWLEEGEIFNASLLLDGGEVVAVRYKYELPNWSVFDEKRIFSQGALPDVIEWREHKLGVMICEDMWHEAVPHHLAQQGAEIFIVLNGSPYEARKQSQRFEVAVQAIRQTGIPLLYVNQVGGQDQLVFDGASFGFNSKSEQVFQAPAWQETVSRIVCEPEGAILQPQTKKLVTELSEIEQMYLALVTGVRDFVFKNKFERVLIGLSGGIDSALVAALAVDALGKEAVRTVMMPSPYTSHDSLEDAAAMSKALGCRLDTIPIANIMKAFDGALVEQFMGLAPDVTEENIQARIRGTILMALSNKSQALVLATGNKSELAVGYTTLYGDMCGGYAPLKDVYKTKVYELVRWRQKNKPQMCKGPGGDLFPARILTKAPSAELKPNQRDQDFLPPYEILDKILTFMLEVNYDVDETISMGQDLETVHRVAVMLDSAEHKRRQSPPGPKVTACHLGTDRRYPITNRYADRWRSNETD